MTAAPAARHIVAAIAGAARRWSEADFPPRVRVSAAIARRMAYSAPVVDYALDALFTPLTQRNLESAIVSEVGTLEALDGFVDHAGAACYAMSAGPALIIASRTTIGVALWPALFGLCAKAQVTVKDREDGLVSAFFATLHDEDPYFGSAASAAAWDGETETRAALFDSAATVVAFGADATLRAIRARCPAETTFVGHGQRISVGFLAARATPRALDELAQRALRDCFLYESEGCLSLRMLFVEEGGADDATTVASALAVAAERVGAEFPPSSEASATGRRSRRETAAFAAAARGSRMFVPREGGVVLDSLSSPPLLAPRVLQCFSVGAFAEVLAYLHRHALLLEALAIEASANDAELASEFGVSRLCRFGDLQRPPLGSHHGGHPLILDFVKLVGRV